MKPRVGITSHNAPISGLRLALFLAAGLLSTTHTQAAEIRARFLPPPGTQLLAVMKTLNELEGSALWRRAPAAVVTYTDLAGLSGLTTPVDSPTGRMHADALTARYPHSALIVGLYLGDSLGQIPSGVLDGQIDRLSATLARYRRPVYLRFGFEFDGPWNHHPPETFVAAWRHFHARISRRGARHIAMVWQSATHCGATFQNRPTEHWYPGDAYVDWVGMSYFSASECGGLLPEGIVNFARRHGKPVMIAESTPRGYDLAGRRFSVDGKIFWPRSSRQIWREWYVPLFDFTKRNADIVRAVTYIDLEWQAYPMWASPPGTSYWGDSRLESNLGILLHWQYRISRDRWLWGNSKLFKSLGYPAPAERSASGP